MPDSANITTAVIFLLPLKKLIQQSTHIWVFFDLSTCIQQIQVFLNLLSSRVEKNKFTMNLITWEILNNEKIKLYSRFKISGYVVPRSTGNTNSGTRELTLKCKLKCYFKPMNNPLGVSPSKGKQGTTRGKEKIF